MVTLPEGKIPNRVILGWDDSPQGNISAHMSLDFIDSDYKGDILFTIRDAGVALPKVEAVDLSKMGVREDDSPPRDIQEK